MPVLMIAARRRPGGRVALAPGDHGRESPVEYLL